MHQNIRRGSHKKGGINEIGFRFDFVKILNNVTISFHHINHDKLILHMKLYPDDPADVQ